MSRKVNLSVALSKAAASKNTQKTNASIVKKNNSPEQSRAPSRVNKKAISGFFDPEVSKQLKQIALNNDSTIQALLAEGLNDLFIKHNQKPIA